MKKYLELSNHGQPLHFIHANGYPPECYKFFLDQFKENFSLIAHLLRPLWDKTKNINLQSWHDLRQDIFNELKKKEQKNMLGLGHSIGGNILITGFETVASSFPNFLKLQKILGAKYEIKKN